METKKIMEIVLGGVVMGLTVGIGINLSNRLMGKIGRKEDEVVMTTKSEMLGGQEWCRDQMGRIYRCGTLPKK
jgi:hypothetical protein